MRRFIAVLLLIGCAPIVLAAEASDSLKDLRAQKKQLQQQRRKLEGQLKQRRRVARDLLSERLAEAEKAIQELKAAHAAAMQEHEAVRAAKAKVAEAQKALDAAVEKALTETPEARKLAELEKSTDRKLDELEYQLGLISLQIEHADSPFLRAVDKDAEINALAAKVAERERAIEDEPGKDVVAARKALSLAEQRVAPLAAEAEDDPKVRKARGAVQAAADALRRAEQADGRRETIRTLREKRDLAEQKAYAKAGPEVVEEIGRIQKDLAALDEQLTALRARLDVYRDRVAATSKSKKVRDAKAQVDASRKALAAAEEEAGIAKLRKQLRAAQAARDEKVLGLIGGEVYYREPAAEHERLTRKIEQMESRIGELSAKEVAELGDARERADELRGKLYHLRREQWRTKPVEPLYVKANMLYHTLGAKRREAPAVVGAREKLERDQKKLRRVLTEDLTGLPAAEKLLEQAREINSRKRDLAYRKAIALYKLRNRRSPIRAKAEADPQLTEVEKALDKALAEMRENPTTAAAKARADLEAARKSLDDALAAHKDLAKARNAERKARRALRRAEGADERQEALKKLRGELRESRVERLDEEAGDLAAQRRKLRRQRQDLREELDQARRDVRQARQKIARGDAKQIVAARAELKDARKALKKAEQSGALEAKAAKIRAAREAFNQELDKLIARDPQVATLNKKIDEVDKKIDKIDKQIKQAKKAE